MAQKKYNSRIVVKLKQGQEAALEKHNIQVSFLRMCITVSISTGQ